MNKDYVNYTHKIGALLSNLNSLEFVVRAALHSRQSAGKSQLDLVFDAKEGEMVGEDYLTNYSSLGELIDEYNAGAKVKLDKVRVIRLRDGFAHGRIFSNDETGTRLLVKFSRAKNGKVTLETKISLSNSFFQKEVPFVRSEIDKVISENRQLQLSQE